MGIAAAIGVASAVAPSVISGISANSAANTQAKAAQNASNVTLGMYNQTRSDLMPYMQTGGAALSQLAQLFGLGGGGAGGGMPTFASAGSPLGSIGQLAGAAIQPGGPPQPGGPAAGGAAAGPGGIASNAASTLANTPGYQFMFGQGVQALDRSAASRGLTLSGAQLQDAQTFGQQYGLANAWQPYVSELNSIGSLGENASAQSGNIGQTAASNAGTFSTGAASNTAAGQIATGNILNQGLSELQQQYGGSSYTGGQSYGGTDPLPGLW